MLVADLLDAPLYEGAASASSLVPSLLPASLDGHAYKVEVKNYQRTTLPAVRQATDQSATPGEQSLATDTYWARFQRTWLYGAGSFISDSLDVGVDNLVQRQRFYDGWNVEPVDPEGIRLARKAVNVQAPTHAPQGQNQIAGTGLYYYWVANGAVYASSTDGSEATCTGFSTDVPLSIATDSNTVWVLTKKSDSSGFRVYSATASNTAFTVLGATYTSPATLQSHASVFFANGHLLTSWDNHIYEVKADGTTTSIDTIAPTSALTTISGWAVSPAFVYLTASTGSIFKISIDNTGTWSTASVALPPIGGVNALLWFQGVMVIAQATGFRIAEVDASGFLSIGSLISLGSVNDLAVVGGQVMMAFTRTAPTDIPAVSGSGSNSGVGVIDLGRSVVTLQPSWYPVWRNVGSSTVSNLIPGASGFVAFASSIYRQPFSSTPDLLYTQGAFVTAWITFGVDVDKSYIDMEMRHDALASGDKIEVYYQSETDASFTKIGESAVDGSTEPVAPFPLGVTRERVRLAFVFTTGDVTSAGAGPRIRRWQMRAFVVPKRSDEIILPVILHRSVKVGEGEDTDMFYDTLAEFEELSDLASSGEIVVHQFGATAELVKVDAVQMKPSKWDMDPDGSYYHVQGELEVRLHTL